MKHASWWVKARPDAGVTTATAPSMLQPDPPMPDAFTIDLPPPWPLATDAPRAALAAALAAEQMGIVSEVDVQATLKAQMGLDSPPHRLLGICGPKVAPALLSAEPDIGALLRCGCGMSEPLRGHTRIALQDPSVIAAASDNADVHAACAVATAALQRVRARLANGTAGGTGSAA